MMNTHKGRRLRAFCLAAALISLPAGLFSLAVPAERAFAAEGEEAEETAETTETTEARLVLPAPVQADEEPRVQLPTEEVEGDAGILRPIVDAINAQREEAGSVALRVETMLMDIAEQRVGEFERDSTARTAPPRSSSLSSETVIRGKADPNTALCAILLSEQQRNNLVYSGYKHIGIAVNETEDIWVIQLSS